MANVAALAVPVAGIDLTAQNANISATTITTTLAAGFYRVHAFIYQRATGTSSVLPTVDIVFTVNSVAITTGTSTGAMQNQGSAANTPSHLINTNNSNATTACGTGSAEIYCDSGINIQFVTAGGTYAGMTYDLHIRVEYLG